MDIVLPEDPAIPILGIYPEDGPTGKKDTCSTMFIAASFIIARSWKKLRCPSTEESQMAEKHSKKCSTSLVIRKIQIKMTWRFYLIPIRMTKIKNASDSTCW